MCKNYKNYLIKGKWYAYKGVYLISQSSFIKNKCNNNKINI